MKLGLLYGGQGSQVEQMGRDFYAHLDRAREIYDQLPYADWIKEQSFSADLAHLSETKTTQPTLMAYQIMVTQLLKEKGIQADGYCGLSIGEYAALAGAGAISPEEAIEIAKFRGEAMDVEAKAVATAMLAILHQTEADVERLIQESQLEDRVFVANINSSQQIVVGGDEEAIQHLSQALKLQKIKAVRLKTAAAFHTRYMAEASRKLGEFLKQRITFQKPTADLYLNRTGRRYTNENLTEIMTSQVQETVRLYDDLLAMLEDGYDHFIEIAPSPVLKKLILKMDPSVQVYSITNQEEYQQVVERCHGK